MSDKMWIMLDPQLCRTFLAVADSRSFTRAGERLGVRQSTISQQVRKLEARTGRALFSRDTHTVELTVDGEAMLAFAQAAVDNEERARRHFAGSQIRGRVRFGASEDYVLAVLPEILRRFRAHNPLVDVELTVDLSDVLGDKLRAGQLDLVLGKRRPGATHGTLLWQEPLVWIGSPVTVVDRRQPVPLVQYPVPSLTRQIALEVLERNGFDWRSVCQTTSLTGLRAAAAGGLGVTVHARSLVPDDLVVLPDLPDPGLIEFVLLSRRSQRDGPVAALARMISDEAAQRHVG